MKFRSKPALWIFYFLGSRFLWILSLTYFFRTEGAKNLRATAENGVIIGFWHNRILGTMVAPIFKELRRKAGIPTCVIVSRHFDGELIVRIGRFFGHDFVRGSSGKGGGFGLRELVERVNAKQIVGITPDGPKGPVYRIKPGIVHLARESGRPILPTMVRSSRKWVFSTWDNFQVPKPFATVTLVFGEPIEHDGDDERTMIRVEEALRALVDHPLDSDSEADSGKFANSRTVIGGDE